MSHVTVFLISLLTGVGSFYAADFFVESAHKFDLTQEEGLAIGFLVTHVLAMLQPFIFKRSDHTRCYILVIITMYLWNIIILVD